VINQLVRYASVLPLLRGEQGPVLEVGSGSDGISAYLEHRTFGLEIRFPGPPGPLLTPIRGTAVDLPFADRSVDVVLIMDTLEHIPKDLRRRCIEEAMRVARSRVIVGGPMGAPSAEADGRLAAYYRRRNLELPDWLAEHLNEKPPELQEVTEPLRAAGWTVRARGNENLPLHLAIMRLETRRFFFRAFGRVRRHTPAAAAAVARALSFGPYYSYLVEATRSQTSSTRPTIEPQS